MVSELDQGWHGRFLVGPRGDSLTPPHTTWPLLSSPGHADIGYTVPQPNEENGSPQLSMSVASTAQAMNDLRRELRNELRAAVEEGVRTIRAEARAEVERLVHEVQSNALKAGHQAQAEAQERAVAA